MSTLDLLRATAPHAPEELRARVLASRPPARRVRRVRPVLVLAAAALLAVAAAVVHGFSTSAPQERATTTVSHGAAAGSGGLESTTDSYNALTKRAAVPAAAPNRITHTDASIRVRVPSTDELGAATNRATR